ncbi:MAG: hypothetical protein GY937_29185 [bacterium]|nr:hypothetical protein [bacterium]
MNPRVLWGDAGRVCAAALGVFFAAGCVGPVPDDPVDHWVVLQLDQNHLGFDSARGVPRAVGIPVVGSLGIDLSELHLQHVRVLHLQMDRGPDWWIRTVPGIDRYVVGVGGMGAEQGFVPGFEPYQRATMLAITRNRRNLII